MVNSRKYPKLLMQNHKRPPTYKVSILICILLLSLHNAGRIIKKFGTTQVMNSILFLFALRMFFYGHMISPWQVVLFEWIHGPIVGLFYPIMTSTAFQISPENLTTTTTAVAYFMEGLGKL